MRKTVFTKVHLHFISALMCLWGISIPIEVMSSWTAMEPVPSAMQLEKIQVLSPDRIWAMGENGCVSRFQNGHWNINPAPDVDIESFKVFNETSAIAVGGSGSGTELIGTILEWDGTSWQSILEVPGVSFLGIWGLSAQDFVVAGTRGNVHRFKSGTWDTINTGSELTLESLWGSGANDVFAAGTSGQYPNYTGIILHWDGMTWEVIYSIDNSMLMAVWGFGPNDVFVVGRSLQQTSSALIIHWDGVTWEDESIETSHYLLDVWGSDPNNVFAIGTAGYIVHRTNDIWAEMESGVRTDLKSIHGSDSNTIFALGSYVSWNQVEQVLIQLKDETWIKVSEREDGSFLDITGNGSNQVVAVGWVRDRSASDNLCTIQQWDGYSWLQSTFAVGGQLNAVCSVSPDSAFAVGESSAMIPSGIIVGWNGVDWQIVSAGVFQPLNDVWGISANDYLAVGDGGLLLKWDGANWYVVNIEIPASLICIWGFSESDVFIGGACSDDGVLYHWNGVSLIKCIETPDGKIMDIWGRSRDDFYLLVTEYLSSSYTLGSYVLHWDGFEWKNVARLGQWERDTDVFNKLFGFGPDDIYAVSSNSETPVLHWNGLAWTDIVMPVPESRLGIKSVWGSAPDELFFAGSVIIGNSNVSNHLILHHDGQESPRELGVRLYPTSKYLTSGDVFQLTGYLDNPGSLLQEVPVFFLLDIMNTFYFWPSWTAYLPPEYPSIDFQNFNVPTGSTAISVIPQFTWPALEDIELEGLWFYGAMLNPDMDEILGEIAQIEWGFGL